MSYDLNEKEKFMAEENRKAIAKAFEGHKSANRAKGRADEKLIKKSNKHGKI